MDALEHIEDLLRRATSEIEYRTITSRAYYGAYKESTALAVSLSFSASNSSADHRGLVEFFASRSDPNCSKIIAPRLRRMHTQRKLADYQFFRRYDKSLAEDALCSLEEVLGAIEAVRRSHKRAKTGRR